MHIKHCITIYTYRHSNILYKIFVHDIRKCQELTKKSTLNDTLMLMASWQNYARWQLKNAKKRLVL